MIGAPASNMSNPIRSAGFESSTNTFGGWQTGSTPFSAGPGGLSGSSTTNNQQQ